MLESRIRTAEQLAAELGVSVWSLKRWAKVYAKGFGCWRAAGGWRPASSRRGGSGAWKTRGCDGSLETVSRQRDILKKKPWASWARNRRILRSDHQDENRAILLQRRRNVPDSWGQSQRPVRSHPEEPTQSASAGCHSSRANRSHLCAKAATLTAGRRIQQMLRRQGIQCGKNRIGRLMDEQALQAVQKRRFRPPTTQSRQRSTDRSQSIEGASRAATATQSGLDRRHHLHPFSARRLALPGRRNGSLFPSDWPVGNWTTL